MLHAPLSAGAYCIAALLLTVSLSPASGTAACSAASGPGTTVLVELYTALACDACPQADRWLADVARRYSAQSLVPLAFHLRAADHTDAGRSSEDRWRRERRLLPRQRLALACTPRVILQGIDFPDWRGARFDDAVEQLAATPSRARLSLAIPGSSDTSLRVGVEAAMPDAASATIYVAAFERRAAGPTALEWMGPWAPGRQELQLALLPKAVPADSGVAGFVQDRRTGKVVQALLLGPCGP